MTLESYDIEVVDSRESNPQPTKQRRIELLLEELPLVATLTHDFYVI